MVISLAMNLVSDPIANQFYAFKSTHQIWKHLQSRFNFSNGARKHKLNKEVYALKQNKALVSENYVKMRGIWEEIDSMNELPTLVAVTDENPYFFECSC